MGSIPRTAWKFVNFHPLTAQTTLAMRYCSSLTQSNISMSESAWVRHVTKLFLNSLCDDKSVVRVYEYEICLKPFYWYVLNQWNTERGSNVLLPEGLGLTTPSRIDSGSTASDFRLGVGGVDTDRAIGPKDTLVKCYFMIPKTPDPTPWNHPILTHDLPVLFSWSNLSHKLHRIVRHWTDKKAFIIKIFILFMSHV